jgi:hypothetical protein
MYLNNRNEIFGLHIINAFSSEELIKFNFSDLILRECYFDNYQGFWQCKFNENTYFVNSYLLNLQFESVNKIPIPKTNFQNCTTDPKFSSAFKLNELIKNNTSEQIKNYIIEFFGLFYSRGLIQPQTINKPHKKHEHHRSLNKKYSGINIQLLTFEDIIEFMKKENILELYNDFAEEKVKIVSTCKNEILKLIKDGTMSSKIAEVIRNLQNLLEK